MIFIWQTLPDQNQDNKKGEFPSSPPVPQSEKSDKGTDQVQKHQDLLSEDPNLQPLKHELDKLKELYGLKLERELFKDVMSQSLKIQNASPEELDYFIYQLRNAEKNPDFNRFKKHAIMISRHLKAVPEENNIYNFETGGNSEVDLYVGAGDIFPAEVQGIKIRKAGESEFSSEIATRSIRLDRNGKPRIGYRYPDGTYAAIHSKDSMMLVDVRPVSDPAVQNCIQEEQKLIQSQSEKPKSKPVESHTDEAAAGYKATLTPGEGKEQKEGQDHLDKTIWVGDSLTDVMSKSGSIEGGKVCFEGGRPTSWMKNHFLNDFLQRDASGKFSLKKEYAGIKKVVILGGFNDITSRKSLESVKENLKIMYEAAKQAGITVVACTLPDWDAKKGREVFDRSFRKKGFGPYPVSAETLLKETDDLNTWILSQNNPQNGFIAVDLHTEMSDHNKYPRGDFVHPSLEGGGKMAGYIMEKAQITASTKSEVQSVGGKVAVDTQKNRETNDKDDHLLPVQLEEKDKYPRDTKLDDATYYTILKKIAPVTPPKGYQNLPKTYQTGEIWKKIQRKAVEVRADKDSLNALKYYGAALAFEIDGEKFAAMLQPHPETKTNPKKHVGVSVYKFIEPGEHEMQTSRPKNTQRSGNSERGGQVRRPEKQKAKPYREALQDLLNKNPGFMEKVENIAAKIGCNPKILLAIMWKESQLRPWIQNPTTTRATGLIQFTRETAQRYGTSVDELAQMSANEQLKYVDRFFSQYYGRNRIKDFADVYLAVFYPDALGKPDDFILGSESKSKKRTPQEMIRLIFNQNPGIAPRGQGYITVGDFRKYAWRSLPAELRNELNS